jgi:hypothetical protein
VIWGDDVGLANVSAYSFGLMGYKTPNIDRIAKLHGGPRVVHYRPVGVTHGHDQGRPVSGTMAAAGDDLRRPGQDQSHHPQDLLRLIAILNYIVPL